jgi:negative regulator of genetic competence, sporulation and motility
MELILIGDSRLKVMLTPEDVRRFAPDLEESELDGPAAKAALRELFDEIRRRSGFDAANDRVLVQLYPSRGGGCEIFLTKLGKVGRSRAISEGTGELAAAPALRPVLFCFAGISELLAVCRQLHRTGYALLSTAYVADDDRYYLVLQEKARSGTRPGALSFVEEFGERRGGATALAYIKEHGRCIVAGDADSRLAALAV